MTHAQKEDLAILETIRDALEQAASGQVFGNPISHDGLTVLPVAKVSGRGGGGSGTSPATQGQEAGGGGVGLSLSAKPLGVYVIKNGKVGWRPAVDVNKVILGGQIVMMTLLMTVRALVRARMRR